MSLPAPGLEGATALLSEDELHKLEEWNHTEERFPGDPCIHELFQAQVERTPDAFAIRDDARRLTFGELDERALVLARHLRRLGVGRDVPVGIFMERSIDMVVALLAVLEAGAYYVPLDPDYPAARTAFMVSDAKARVLLTQASLGGRVPPSTARVVRVDADWEEIARGGSDAGGERASPDDLSYVIYTSGSTGKPKGVQIRHRGVVNLLESMAKTLAIDPRDRVLGLTSLSFDPSVLEIFLPLSVGAELVLASPGLNADPERLRAFLVASEVTLAQATPVTWRLLVAAGWKGAPRLQLLCGGEALTRDLADQLLARARTVWNVYGPTETTVWSTMGKVRPGKGTVPVGRPIANTQMYVVDEHRSLVPIGVAGELLIGGVGVARGYLDRPELSSKLFVRDPFSPDPDARLYRSGDLARYLPDGTIEHLGRIDFQVKIRGHRIELGEIESQLCSHPGVKQAVVVARDDPPRDKRLAAYVVSKPGAVVTAHELKKLLASVLADYMVPRDFVFLPELPLTPSRKVDRRALPEPVREARPSDRPFQGPRDLIEEKLARIWEEVLGTGPVDVIDDVFLDLGADSISATTAGARIRETLRPDVGPELLLEHRSIAQQAEVLRRTDARIACTPIVTLRKGPAKPDFFFTHSAGVDAFSYVPLVRRLDGEDTIHVLQNPHRYAREGSYRTTQEMASDYLAVVKSIQPRGPYRLGGYSLGGPVAFELANRLLAEGEEVRALILLDPDRPMSLASRTRARTNRYFSRWRFRALRSAPELGLRIPGARAKLAALRETQPLRRFGLLLRMCRHLSLEDEHTYIPLAFPGEFDPAQLAALGRDAALEHVFQRLKGASHEAVDVALFGLLGTDAASTRQRARVVADELLMTASYTTDKVYPGTITIFTVRGNPDGPAWQPFTSRPIDLHEYDVKGTHAIRVAHNAMMEDENAALYVKDFQSFLERTRPSG